MAASTLESEAAFKERATQIGIEDRFISKFVKKNFAAFGKYAFCVVYSPSHPDEAPLKRFLQDLLEEEPAPDQMASLRRLFFESHTMALTDARQRVEAQPDPSMATRKMATAERVARQREQESRLGGLVFTPETTPANHLVDLFVDMGESGVLSYIKPEQCCSRAQEIQAIKKDVAVSTDASGMLKLGTKISEPMCEANTELKLRSAFQRRNLAMDLAGLASFETAEGWTQLLFSHLLRDPPRGFAKVSPWLLIRPWEIYVRPLTRPGRLMRPSAPSRRQAVEIVVWCHDNNVLISIENPANSWLWAALVALAREHSFAAAVALGKLQMVLFHACCHGSSRRKHTGWLSTPGVFDALNATCQNDHEHEPWGVKWNAGTWVFDTATEAHYPHLLAQRAVECIVRSLLSRGFSVDKPLRLHDRSTAVQGKQSKKHKSLVPEYHRIVSVKTGDPPPANSKLLPPHFQGADPRRKMTRWKGHHWQPFQSLEFTIPQNSFFPWLKEFGILWAQPTTWRLLQSMPWILFFDTRLTS